MSKIFISFFLLFFFPSSFAQIIKKDNVSKNKKEILEAINSFNKNNSNNNLIIINESNDKTLNYSTKKENNLNKKESISEDLKIPIIQNNNKNNTKETFSN